MTEGDTNAGRQTPGLDPDVRDLGILVGEWTLEITASDPALEVQGHASFEWLTEDSFLILRWEVEHPVFPDAISIIGLDDSTGEYSHHYFDTRGVHGVYEMSLEGGVWKQWRDWPGFSQRFTGTFSDDGEKITGAWEKCLDGTNWEHDLDWTYTKVG